jgi:hypothetical protein
MAHQFEHTPGWAPLSEAEKFDYAHAVSPFTKERPMMVGEAFARALKARGLWDPERMMVIHPIPQAGNRDELHQMC